MLPEQYAQRKRLERNMDVLRKNRAIPVDPEVNRRGLAMARRALARAGRS